MVIPTNLVTGFLGVGKTTSLLQLLQQKTSPEPWAILVNEFGEVSIDAAILQGSSRADQLHIQDVAGGCVCCTSAQEFRWALTELLSQVRPKRLFIETTGVGHPARILELLRSPKYQEQVDLRCTLCFIDPRDYEDPQMQQSQVWRDQIELADVLLLNKKDRASNAVQQHFLNWANGLFPPKVHVGITEKGTIDRTWLDWPSDSSRTIAHPNPHMSGVQENAVRHQFGAIFPATVRFDEEKLLTFLTQLSGIRRLKGVFQLEEDWYLVNRTRNDWSFEPTLYRRDSRIEILAEQPIAVEMMTQALQQCQIQSN